jgi:hypothetical protein
MYKEIVELKLLASILTSFYQKDCKQNSPSLTQPKAKSLFKLLIKLFRSRCDHQYTESSIYKSAPQNRHHGHNYGQNSGAFYSS